MLEWIRKHPQRTASFLLVALGTWEANMALLQTAITIPPLWNAGIKIVFGILMATLAWVVKNTKDEV